MITATKNIAGINRKLNVQCITKGSIVKLTQQAISTTEMNIATAHFIVGNK